MFTKYYYSHYNLIQFSIFLNSIFELIVRMEVFNFFFLENKLIWIKIIENVYEISHKLFLYLTKNIKNTKATFFFICILSLNYYDISFKKLQISL